MPQGTHKWCRIHKKTRPGIWLNANTTKTEKSGEKLNVKHCYCNSLEPVFNLFLSLGVFFCLNQLHFKTSPFLFKEKNTTPKSGGHAYCSQLAQLFSTRLENIKCYIRIKHANSHGFRKGSSTHAASGTTCTPSITSIAKRGDWSLGKILDIYWKFVDIIYEINDSYC